ncbi:conserved hypothetical protein [Azoarcus olearius]|uniref:DOMON-like domain-containing protein n=1 Tax=Azoarcus sp. (strain BH72) TaxID=418699 RepID=A1KBV8_AZOSB|nr:hypothetical protein dqs_3843 [Azoarcus olearius]CAL96314.1 conserved hypothetical protein [Azoarcus olearius]
MRHPDHPARAVLRIHAAVVVEADLRLTLHYHLRGRLDALRVPTPDHALPADRLWAHTCFEVFIARSGSPAYREFNFSPSGQWASYLFDDYRARIDALPPAPPRLEVLRSGDLLSLSATLDADALPAGMTAQTLDELRLGISAVVEAADGRLSYWALAHPAERPDFHDARAFCWQAPEPDPYF